MRLIVDVKVTDLDRAVAFYTQVLELNLRVQEKEWAAVCAGDAEIHLYLDGGVTESVEFYVQDLETAVHRLIKHNVEIIPGTRKPSAIKVDELGITEFPWGRTAFFKDTEGNELALVKDLE